MNSHVVVIGKQVAPKEFELVGAGAPSFIVAGTRVTAHVQRLLDEGRGEKVLADIEPGERNGARCGIATFVRELEANDEDLRRLEVALAPYRRAGIAAFIPEPAQHLREVFASLASKGFPSWNPQAHLVEFFLRDQTSFPEGWWHDEPEYRIDEMVGFLKRLGVKGEIPKAKVLADALNDLDRSESEDEARDRLCAVLCAAANALLASEGHENRLCGPYYGSWDDGEPNWIFCKPDFFETLIREGVLSRSSGQREKPVDPYKRPPDLGEMDLDKFPSGDDPF